MSHGRASRIQKDSLVSWPTIDPNTWPAVWSATAATASAITAMISLWVASRARKSMHQGQMQSWLLSYVKEHASLLEEAKVPDPFEPAAYRAAAPHIRNRTNIVAGLLVCTVELMQRSRDIRADEWINYIAVLRGPLLSKDFPLESYATTVEMKRRIQHDRHKLNAGEGGGANFLP